VKPFPGYDQTQDYVAPRQDNLNSHIICTFILQQGRRDSDPDITTQIALNVHRISISLAKGSPIPEHSTPTIIKALPSMKLQTLQQKLRKTFKVPPKAEMNLYLEMSDTIAELESGDSRDLIWWGLDDGSNLFVYIP